MPVLEDVFRREVAAVGVVYADVVVVVVVAVAVDEHYGYLALLHLLVKLVGVHAYDDYPVEVALLRERQVALVRVRGGDEDMVAALAGAELDAAEYLAVKLVLEHEPPLALGLGHDDAYELAVVARAGERARGHIRRIAQLLYRLLHALARLVGYRPLAAYGVADRRRGDPRRLGDVLHCDSLTGHLYRLAV